MVINVPLEKLAKGDTLAQEDGQGWTAISDTTEDPDGSIACMVQYADGGVSMRIWDEPKGIMLPIHRENPTPVELYRHDTDDGRKMD